MAGLVLGLGTKTLILILNPILFRNLDTSVPELVPAPFQKHVFGPYPQSCFSPLTLRPVLRPIVQRLCQKVKKVVDLNPQPPGVTFPRITNAVTAMVLVLFKN